MKLLQDDEAKIKRTRSSLVKLGQFPLTLQNLGSRGTRRVQHDRDDGCVVGPQVLLVPTLDGAIDQSFGRVDPLAAGRWVEHVLLVRLLGLADVKHGLSRKQNRIEH